MATTTKYPIKVKLTGQDSNAMNLMSIVARALRSHKVPKEEIDAFYAEAMSGDYQNVLTTCGKWVHVS